MLINPLGIIDDARCYEMVRQLRWPGAVRCPRRDSAQAVEQGRDETDPKPFGQCLAALGLSRRARVDAGHAIDVAVLDLGSAQIVLLPGESYVEDQRLARRARPDSFVMAMGHGEAGTGYVPTDEQFEEGDSNLDDWCWVAPGSEGRMARPIAAALRKQG
jgi:hypothetical protein